MNLSQELWTSLVWIFKVIAIILMLSPFISFILIKTTRWGKQFWQLSADYFSFKNSLKPTFYFVIVLFFSLVTVRVDILLSEWNKALYNALQHLNAAEFWHQIIVFTILATVHVINALLIYYLRQSFTIHWRLWMNNRMLDKWTTHQAYYKTLYLDKKPDNPDQRIQQDVTAYISTTLNLSLGLIKSITSMISFTLILWGLSGPMTIGHFTLPHAMVFLVFIYVLISTFFAFKIGQPLIKLNFNNERLNANYRYSLMRLKEYAESIALFRGEKTEKNQLQQQFNHVINNVWQIVYRTLKFNGFNLTVTQASVIFPFIIQATRFFEKQIQLGELMQTTQAFRKVQTSLSFFRNIYDDFAGYRAVLDRLTEFNQAIQQTEHKTSVHIHDAQDNVIIEHLHITTPDEQILIKDLNLQLKQGDTLLIQGQSGIGKTTLLRAIAGLWREAQGHICLPLDQTLFIPQKPYLPQGSLVEALYYPQAPSQHIETSALTLILHKVHLSHLTEKLDENNDWTRILSLGEQQRLAFARVLLLKPSVIFLDEATSALDSYLEEQMYLCLKKELPNAIIVSVAHHTSLHQHHKQLLRIEQNGKWEFIPT